MEIGNNLLTETVKKVNSRPLKEDWQDVPSTVKEIMRLKKEAKTMPRRRKKKKNHLELASQPVVKERGMTRPLKPVPDFKQGPRESESHFMHRIERESSALLNKVKLEEKFKVDLDIAANGEVKVKKQKRSKKKKERQKMKDMRKKDQKLQRRDKKKTGFEELNDDVAFGEIASEPPAITAMPRKAAPTTKNRPGVKSLLLKNIIHENQLRNPSVNVHRHIGETTKRRNLSMARQKTLDCERERVIEIYRTMKAEKLKASMNI
ncbi:hypothetical protein LSAT2_025416 [Lamellibrachia satsuma]|nr:hypothetical protein LSAT2_025416 [Lamellibrachia satsuma]